MQLKRVSRKTPSAYLFPARRFFGGGLYTMASSLHAVGVGEIDRVVGAPVIFAGRIDHGHAVRFEEGAERVHVVAARKLEVGQIEPREPSIKFNQSLYK
jgi:hypothetical protein